MKDESLIGEVTELTQALIRNACVNDGSPEGGNESRNAQTLRDYLDGCNADITWHEPVPGRASLVARLEGTDATPLRFGMQGHIDVVPVNVDTWTVDPFGGELIDSRIWGRGAIDMLGLTASMAVALRHLASQPRLAGTLILAAVADEERGGELGAKYLLDNHKDLVDADGYIGEWGGVTLPFDGRPKVGFSVAERGSARCRIRVPGRPGHGSAPYLTDNAVLKAVEVIRRLDESPSRPVIGEVWKRFVTGLDLPDEIGSALLDPHRIDEGLAQLSEGIARRSHAATRTTITPTVVHGGSSVNVLPPHVDIDFDIRVLPGVNEQEVRTHIGQALGDLSTQVEVSFSFFTEATESPVDTPLWHALTNTVAQLRPDLRVLPQFHSASTDAVYFRKAGIPSYGAGLFSPAIELTQFTRMFHGNDEWIDQESLRLSTELWIGTAQQLLA